MLFLLAAAHAAPSTVQVTYTVRYDLDAMGDRICAFTKLCDCTSTYVGAGELVATEADRLTFRGTWTRTANTCSDPLLVWTPPDGAAHHTLRHQGGRLTEWVVHAGANRHERLTSEMKANGQFWMNELAQPWPGTTFVSQQRDGTTLAGGIRLDATHELRIQLSE